MSLAIYVEGIALPRSWSILSYRSCWPVRANLEENLLKPKHHEGVLFSMLSILVKFSICMTHTSEMMLMHYSTFFPSICVMSRSYRKIKRWWGVYFVFGERPLHPCIIAYCVQDGALLFQLEVVLKTKFGRRGKNWQSSLVIIEFAACVAEAWGTQPERRRKSLDPLLWSLRSIVLFRWWRRWKFKVCVYSFSFLQNGLKWFKNECWRVYKFEDCKFMISFLFCFVVLNKTRDLLLHRSIWNWCHHGLLGLANGFRSVYINENISDEYNVFLSEGEVDSCWLTAAGWLKGKCAKNRVSHHFTG